MAYNLKDVFYLGATHEFAAGTYGSAGIEGNIPIDISAYVDPIAKGRQRGQGLAVYKVHCQVAGDVTGNPQISTDAGQAVLGLTVKPYTTSGDNSSALQSNDMTPESDLLIWGVTTLHQQQWFLVKVPVCYLKYFVNQRKMYHTFALEIQCSTV